MLSGSESRRTSTYHRCLLCSTASACLSLAFALSAFSPVPPLCHASCSLRTPHLVTESIMTSLTLASGAVCAAAARRAAAVAPRRTQVWIARICACDKPAVALLCAHSRRLHRCRQKHRMGMPHWVALLCRVQSNARIFVGHPMLRANFSWIRATPCRTLRFAVVDGGLSRYQDAAHACGPPQTD